MEEEKCPILTNRDGSPHECLEHFCDFYKYNCIFKKNVCTLTHPSFIKLMEDITNFPNGRPKIGDNNVCTFPSFVGLEMFTDSQLAFAVLSSNYNDKVGIDIGRLFLQILAKRDTGKAFQVFQLWKDGKGTEALEELF